MNLYTAFVASAHFLFIIKPLIGSLFNFHQKICLVTAWLLTLSSATLRCLSTEARAILMVGAVWTYALLFLERTGIFHNFRLSLVGTPLAVMILVGVRSGLILGAIHIAFLLTAFWATNAGLLPQAPPLWSEDDFWIQSSAIIGTVVPQLLLLAWFSHHLSTSIRRVNITTARLRAEATQRERLENEVFEAVERESLRIGHELHDGVCQDLTGLLIRSKRVQKKLDIQSPPGSEELGGIVQGLGEAIGEIHGLSKRLSPGLLAGRDLAGAIEALVQQFYEIAEAEIEFQSSGTGPALDSHVTLHLFRIAQEALSNAVRHSDANRIAVILTCNPAEAVLRVDDDGQGFALDSAGEQGLGLKTMQWRADKANGILTILPRPEGGTRVECRIPLQVENRKEKRDA